MKKCRILLAHCYKPNAKSMNYGHYQCMHRLQSVFFKMSFQPAQPNTATHGAPTSYQFVGSNDAVCNDDASWTILCEDLSDREWRNYWKVRFCRVKPEINEKFRCLGIRVLANRRPDGASSLRNIRMWRKISA